MTEPIKLYFDKVEANGTHGQTFNVAKIYYNFEKIDKQAFDLFINSVADKNGSSIMLNAGRFLVVVSLTFDKDQQGMFLFDLGNDEKFAKSISENKPEEEKQRFMNIFYSMQDTYNNEYDRFILIEGTPLSNEKK